MIEPMTISAKLPEHPGMNFNLLRKEGVEFIQKLCCDSWTDLNTHDPGITILEHLCYAITDLSYRLDFDIQDLLAYPAKEKSGPECKQFFTAGEILPCNPITITDYRKLLIDIDGVRNAWIECKEDNELREDNEEAVTTGLYSVLIEKESVDIYDNNLIDQVKSQLNSHRNLCENFEEIRIMPTEEVSIQANIFIEETCDPDQLAVDIYYRIANLISPTIQFYDLHEMIAKNGTIEEIFEGPLLRHGFIDVEELEAIKPPYQIFLSDLIHLIQDMPEVESVNTITIYGKSSQPCEWVLDIEYGHAPRLSGFEGVRFWKGKTKCTIDHENVRQKLNFHEDSSKRIRADKEMDIPVPPGEVRELSEYETIQNDFPANYGIGYLGLPGSASFERKAQAKQLRAYLMLFDQLLTNYFAQLDHAKRLFSPFYQGDQTYFSQLLPEETGIKELSTLDEEYLSDMVESPKLALDRRNRFLDHLLARYAERFVDQSLLYSQKEANHEHDSLLRHINTKQRFLQHYPEMSGQRAKAFNYFRQDDTWNTNNVSVLKKRIYSKLDISDHSRKNLSIDNVEGFHLLEHILLRPSVRIINTATASNQPRGNYYGGTNPFSFRISLVIPDWTGRFRKPHFRRIVEDTVLEETPAHITVHFRWVNRKQMGEFERMYRRWLEEKSRNSKNVDEYTSKLIEYLTAN